MGGDQAEDVEDAMTALRVRSVARNLERVEVVAQALEWLRDGTLDADAREEARRAAHSVAGSAGTFGFARATVLARSVESLFVGEEPADPQAAANAGLSQLEELRAALSSCGDDGAG